MKIIVGLGNPGPRYETTPHNVGFLAVDRLVDRWKAQGPAFKNEGEIYQASYGGEKITLIKPQTFMNLSGRCVGPLMSFFKCQPTDLIVIHDELDLKPFALRIKTGGGTGGHNGLKSIDEHLGAGKTGYHRVRMGIGHPRMFNSPMSPSDYVLRQYSQSDLDQLDPFLDTVAEAIELIVKGDVRRAMTDFNRDPAPKD